MSADQPEHTAPTSAVEHRRRRAGAMARSVALVMALGVGGAAAHLRARTDGWVTPAPTVTRGTTEAASDDGYAGPGPGPYSSYVYGNDGEGSGAPTGSTTEASSSQSAGLVEITSSLTNGQTAGTGLIWTSTGVVVTNLHVVAGATSVEVTVASTGETYSARYLGGDATVDIAVLRLTGASGLDVVEQSAAVAQVGEEVTAVGDANGDGGSLTAAEGTVVATGRDITVQDDAGRSGVLNDLVEISADVVPGDSGGAVLDADGAVVAMTVAASNVGRDVTGYAIPIATVDAVVEEILAGQGAATIDLGHVGVAPSATLSLGRARIV